MVAAGDQAVSLRGSIDTVTRSRIAGWAQDPGHPDTPVTLLITSGDVLLARVLADRWRGDLRDAGIGDGRHSFDVVLQGLASRDRHLITVRREGDGVHLGGSPVVLERNERFDDAFRTHCTIVLGDVGDDAGLLDRLAFLAAQTEALLRLRAERRSRRSERVQLQQIKWRWTESDGTAAPSTEHLPPRALVIDEWMPTPSRDAGSNAVLSHMHALQRLGFEVTFVAADMADDKGGVLEAAGIACCHAPWHGSVEEVLRREADCFDLVYLHRVTVAARYLGLARVHQPKTRIIYSVADLHHVRYARQAVAEKRPELLGLARRFLATEMQAAAAAHAVLTHSSYEAKVIHQHLPEAQVYVVPWSVPVRATGVPFAERSGVAFIGHYGHTPNLDAAQWLVDEIMPLVRATHPQIACLLAGSNMPEALRAKRPGIEPIGQVGSLATVFDRVRLTVAPMTYGAGIKGKVLESLAAGIPCVCSPIAAEGLDLPPTLQSLVAADAAGIAANIVRLHEDAALNVACRNEGLAYVAATLSEERIDTLMRAVAALPAGQHGVTGSELAMGRSAAPVPVWRHTAAC